MGPISLDVLGQVAVSLVEALLYLHEEQGILHLDVRPARVFANQLGEIKLGGFSLSTSFDDQCTTSFLTINPSKYMSACPERILGQSSGSKADVWGLGITLLELAQGCHPFTKYFQKNDLFLRITGGFVFELPSGLDLPEPFQRLVRKCLETAPDLRATLRELNVS